MDRPIQEIEQLCVKKVTLLEELRDCLALERESLMNVNVENIWLLHEEKQKIVRAIRDAEEEIRNIREMAYPDDRLPVGDRRRLNDLFHRISSFKEEIRTRIRENVSLIQESLTFFDELISLFFKVGRRNYSYSPVRQNQE